jgi:hypothetical protein
MAWHVLISESDDLLTGQDKGKGRVTWEVQGWVDPVDAIEYCTHAAIDRDFIEMAPVIDDGMHARLVCIK